MDQGWNTDYVDHGMKAVAAATAGVPLVPAAAGMAPLK